MILGVRVNGDRVTANPSALLMEVDGTVGENVYRSNLYVSGKIEGRTPNGNETAVADFAPDWFAKFPAALEPRSERLQADREGSLSREEACAFPGAPTDRNGAARTGGQVELRPHRECREMTETQPPATGTPPRSALK